MERLRTRAVVLGMLLVAAGLAIQLTPSVNLPRRTEAFLEAKAPTKVGDFKFFREPLSSKPEQSYAVAPETYTTLNPFGVVARIFRKGDEAYDVLLIAGNDKGTFHDQRVCFTSQGWTIVEETREALDTSRGRIVMTFARLQRKDRPYEDFAAYFYKGPGDRWFAMPQQLTWAMFVEQFWGGTDLESAFYRFIPVNPGTTKKQLLSFIKLYIEEAGKFSGGYF